MITPSISTPVDTLVITPVYTCTANPDAAPEDIALAARKYLSDLANSLSDKSTKTEDTKNEPIDYMQYLG